MLFRAFLCTALSGVLINHALASDQRITRSPSADGQKLAYVIGIDQYNSVTNGLEQLNYAVTDAEAMTNALTKLGFKVQPLYDKKATSDALDDLLADISEIDLDHRGTIVFYFSGHGFQSGGENFIFPADTTIRTLGSKGVPLTRILNAIRKTDARQAVIFLDACRSVGDRGPNEQRTFGEFNAGKGVAVLMSTRPGRVSREFKELGHGVFTKFLADALGGAGAHDCKIDFDDVKRYVTEGVQGWTEERHVLQVPRVTGEYEAPISLGELCSNPPPPPPPEPDELAKVVRYILEHRFDSIEGQVIEIPPERALSSNELGHVPRLSFC
jgi:uncharacterized caspase-like protein